MNNPKTSPPRNEARSAAKGGTTKRSRIGCTVVALLLVAGLAAAGVLWGPTVSRLFFTQTIVAPTGLGSGVDAAELAAQRLDEVAQLNGYGWVDQEANIVHIPIDEAMALIAQEGLPVGVTPAAVEAAAGAPETAAAPPVDLAHVGFKDNVLPIFEQHCVECHGDEKSEEGLKLLRYRTVMGGSQNGPVIAPGDPDNSYLVEMIVSGKMPKEGDPLPPTDIEVIKAWIEAGALDN